MISLRYIAPFCCCFVLFAACATTQHPKPEELSCDRPNQIRPGQDGSERDQWVTARGNEFVRIHVSCHSGSWSKLSWEFTFDSNGSVILKLAHLRREPKQFSLTKDQLGEVSRTLTEIDFAGLQDEYGIRVIDGTTLSVTVGTRDSEKTVLVHYLGLLRRSPFEQDGRTVKADLMEASRFLKLWVVLRGLLEDAEAVDNRTWIIPFLREVENLVRTGLQPGRSDRSDQKRCRDDFLERAR